MQHRSNGARLIQGRRKIPALLFTAALAALTGLAGCLHNPDKDSDVHVSFNPLQTIEFQTVLGTIKINFGQERQRMVASEGQLAKQPAVTKDSLLFRGFGFDTGLLPEGCKPFEDGRYGKFVLPHDGAGVASIEKKIEELKKQNGVAPDEAVIALAIYKARAFQSLCGPPTIAKLKAGSRINGWLLNEKAVASFEKIGQGEIDVTPKIIIVALAKGEFDGRIKPTAANVLLSKFRFDIPPNSDSIVSDPKTGATVLAYSQNLQDIQLGNVTRNVLGGGVLRVFVGKNYIYLIELYTSTAGLEGSKWMAYQKYVDSFRYIGEVTENRSSGE